MHVRVREKSKGYEEERPGMGRRRQWKECSYTREKSPLPSRGVIPVFTRIACRLHFWPKDVSRAINARVRNSHNFSDSSLFLLSLFLSLPPLSRDYFFLCAFFPFPVPTFAKTQCTVRFRKVLKRARVSRGLPIRRSPCSTYSVDADVPAFARTKRQERERHFCN